MPVTGRSTKEGALVLIDNLRASRDRQRAALIVLLDTPADQRKPADWMSLIGSLDAEGMIQDGLINQVGAAIDGARHLIETVVDDAEEAPAGTTSPPPIAQADAEGTTDGTITFTDQPPEPTSVPA